MRNKVNLLDKLLFTKNFSVMVNSGISMNEALEKLRDQTESRRLKFVLDSMLKDTTRGKTLAKSMHEYPDVFDQFFVSLIEVGEQTGKLAENLNYLADKLSNQYERLQSIHSEMMSHFIVLGVVTILVSLVFSLLF